MLEKIKKMRKLLYPFKYDNFKILTYYQWAKQLKEKKHYFWSKYFERKIYKKYHCIIPADAVISSTVKIPHPTGIVIGAGSVIKENVTIFQNVTIGRKNADIWEYPIVNEDCTLYSNSVVIGNIELAPNTIVGANAVITKNTEKNSIYAGIPARKIGEHRDER